MDLFDKSMQTLELPKVLEQLASCAVCGAAFVPKSNRGKYCPGCAGRIKKIKAAERKRKQRHKCHALEPFKPA